MTPVPEPIRFMGQKERAERIPEALGRFADTLERLDTITIEEAIDTEAHDILATGLFNMGFIYKTDQIVGSLTDFKVVQGGVVLFSRHPITKQVVKMFDRSARIEDCLVAKGVVYACVEKFGQPFHVFSVHAQSWESEVARSVRQSQFMQVHRLICDMNISEHEPVILLGDFNVDLYSEQRQLSVMFDILHAEMLPRHKESHPFTSDPSTNVLMGLDDATSYASRAFPNGCNDEYLKRGTCVCCPCEWLDYALVSTNHAPIDRDKSYMRCIPVKFPVPFETNINWTHKRSIQDLSDHYPVLAKYEFPSLLPKAHVQNTAFIVYDRKFRKRPDPLVYNLSFFIVFAVFIAISALFVIWALIR